MQKLKGIPAAAGVAVGPAFVYQEGELEVERYTADDPDAEWSRLQGAIEQAREKIQQIRDKAEAEAGEEEAVLFDAHAMFLEDPSLLDTVGANIEGEGLNAEAAWSDAIESFAQRMEAMEDEYFQQRAADVRDVGRRVLRILMGQEEGDVSALIEPSIVVARDLTPSDTVRFDKELVLGFCTAGGGPTSHTAILARTLELPAVVGAGDDLLEVTNDATLAIDGDGGELIVNPREDLIRKFEERSRRARERAQKRLAAAGEPAITTDDHQVEVVANVGRIEDTEAALEYGAEGIGLLRTEFLYLERQTEPDEEEQLEAYDAILDAMGQRPVIVRTLDVGGDKPLPYLDLGEEENPFLGWRAIRVCLDRPKFFKVQLRALLRAGPGHDLRIMFPMVATLDEVRRGKELLAEARSEVQQAGKPVAGEAQVGIMVEVPSVSVLADKFAAEVDFFSIGTNDLTQYTMAAERGNEKVAYLNDALHPALLRQVQSVIDAGHGAGIWVGMCGELAGDPEAVPILLGLGLDEFSMAPAAIPQAKAIVRQWSFEKARGLATEVLDLDSAEAVRDYVCSTTTG